jgi:integrase
MLSLTLFRAPRPRHRGATTLEVYAAWVDEADRQAATTMPGIMSVPVAAPRAPRGPYEVIAAELREQIVTGRLRAGDQRQP